MHAFIKVSKKLDPNQQIPTTVILQLQNNKAWKVLWCFQHGLVTLLVRLWQLLLMVSPTGGADIPGTLLHPTAIPMPGCFLPEMGGCKSHQLPANGLCSAHSNIQSVKTHAQHSPAAWQLFWWHAKRSFLSLLICVFLWLLGNFSENRW